MSPLLFLLHRRRTGAVLRARAYWCPFRLQFYCNGHNWLARQLERKKIRYTLLDNAFTAPEDCAAGQALADSWDPSFLHRKLDEFAQRYCPILKQIEETYHWSR